MTTELFTRRILPAAEWDRIADRDLAALVPLLPPEDVQIVVVEQGDRLVGCCGAQRWTPRWVMAGASDHAMTDLITRHLDGQPMPLSLYAVPIPGGDPCHRS